MAEERLRAVRDYVDRQLGSMTDADERRVAVRHLDGVASLATMLALVRGDDAELAAVAGHLHDLHSYLSGIRVLHAVSGAEFARPMLRDTHLFTDDEVRRVVTAIFHHSDKAARHDPLSEVLKDADVLQHYLRDPADDVSPAEATRLASLAESLGLRASWRVATPPPRAAAPAELPIGERLAAVAEEQAASGIIGEPDDARFRAICRPFGGDEVLGEFRSSWCAAFVFDCCRRAGLALPIRHPGVSCRFGAVRGWLEWAQLADVAMFQPADSAPRRGDLLIYDDLLGNGPHDHIGVVVAVSADGLSVAEGNANGQNVSAVVNRDRDKRVGGFIRLAEHYAYAPHGEPDWAV